MRKDTDRMAPKTTKAFCNKTVNKQQITVRFGDEIDIEIPFTENMAETDAWTYIRDKIDTGVREAWDYEDDNMWGTIDSLVKEHSAL